MEEHRALFIRVMEESSHNLRCAEHEVFNRLMYRSKNQHRHGMYFHRLDHVRRLLRKLNAHEVFNSLRVALGPSYTTTNPPSQHPGTTTTPGRHKPQPLTISTLTRDDVVSAVQLLNTIVQTVIPKAAIAVTLQLISRGQFLPFGVTVIACLARIFVIERKLCADLHAIMIELNILFSTGNASDSPAAGVHDGLNEDVGLIVESPTRETPAAEISKPAPVVQDAPLRDNDEPSLYTVMAQHGINTNTIAKLTARTTVTLPDVAALARSADSVPPIKTIGKTKREKSRKERSLLVTQVKLTKFYQSTEPHSKIGEQQTKTGQTRSSEHESDSEDLDDILEPKKLVQSNSTSQSTSAGNVTVFETEQRQPKQGIPAHDSDSEDLDDIFDALD